MTEKKQAKFRVAISAASTAGPPPSARALRKQAYYADNQTLVFNGDAVAVLNAMVVELNPVYSEKRCLNSRGAAARHCGEIMRARHDSRKLIPRSSRSGEDRGDTRGGPAHCGRLEIVKVLGRTT